MRYLLRALARLILDHPLAVLLTVATPTLVLGLFLLRTPVDLSLTGVMDRSNPEVARYFDASRKYRLGGRLIVLLEGDEDQLDEAVEAMRKTLATHPEVRVVTPPIPEEWLTENAPWLVDRDLFDAWVRQIREPTNLQNGLLLQARFEELAQERQRLQPDGARLVEIEMNRDPFDEAMGGDAFFSLERSANDALRNAGVTDVQVSFSGMPAVAAQDQASTLGTIRRLSPLSLILVLVLFHFVERRWLGLMAVIAPLLLSVAGTLGAIGLLTGRLTVMETFFGVTVFGLGIDFAIHLLVRQREERAHGREFGQALEATLAGTGRGVLAGAVTTAGAFFIVALAPDPVAVHLGLSGGLGLMICLVLMLTLLPATWVLLERRRHSKDAAPPKTAISALPIPLVSGLSRHAVRHPWFHLGLAAVVLLVAVAGLPRLYIETNVNKVFNRNVPAVRAVERVAELFQLNGAPWILSANTVDEAAEKAAQLTALDNFSVVSSVVDFVPPADADQEDRRRILEEVQPSVASTLELGERLLAQAPPTSSEGASNESANPANLQRQLAEGLIAAARTLETAHRQGPPTLEELPEGLSRRFIAPTGELLVFAYSAGSTFDARKAREDRLAAQTVDPEATGLSATLEAVMIARRPWLVPVALGILAFVAVILAIDFRRPKRIVLALVPVVLGVGVTFGALCWAGIAFNVMTSLVLPLIVGLGVDDGIHVVHRMIEQTSETLDQAAAAVGRAIVMTTATTCSSFAILMLTDHAGLETMGLIMLIGLPICLIASITTLPALATVLVRDKASL